jgi:D-alanyl-D-alanine carboxypeptidase (penicillin-binding protein 5/6)
MKKITTIFFVFILLNMSVFPAYGIEPEDLQSRSAILINADDGRVLFEKNANDKMQPASITKIMLMVLISERMRDGLITPDQEMTISENAAGMGGSQRGPWLVFPVPARLKE